MFLVHILFPTKISKRLSLIIQIWRMLTRIMSASLKYWVRNDPYMTTADKRESEHLSFFSPITSCNAKSSYLEGNLTEEHVSQQVPICFGVFTTKYGKTRWRSPPIFHSQVAYRLITVSKVTNPRKRIQSYFRMRTTTIVYICTYIRHIECLKI